MKVNLQVKITVKGYSQLFGIDHKRIKARAKTICNSCFSPVKKQIRKNNGSYTSEYRLVKEPKGFIFREVLGDHGISGHHKTMKKAIVSAIHHVNVFIDEEFEYENIPEFQKIKKYHLARANCKHYEKYYEKRFKRYHCPTCNTTLD
ncbi:hypothetical protein R8G61_07905 [Tenacibaculum maritimum]